MIENDAKTKISWRKSLGFKILMPTIITLVIGSLIQLIITIKTGTDNLLEEDRKKSDLTATSVIKSMQSMMLNGRAMDVEQWIDDLKTIDKKEVAEIDILRLTGEVGFKDNHTINDVNNRLGGDSFERRKEGTAPNKVAMNRWYMIIISSVMTLIVLTLIWRVIKKSATGPITGIVNLMGDIANGDLTQKIDVTSED